MTDMPTKNTMLDALEKLPDTAVLRTANYVDGITRTLNFAAVELKRVVREWRQMKERADIVQFQVSDKINEAMLADYEASHTQASCKMAYLDGWEAGRRFGDDYRASFEHWLREKEKDGQSTVLPGQA